MNEIFRIFSFMESLTILLLGCFIPLTCMQACCRTCCCPCLPGMLSSCPACPAIIMPACPQLETRTLAVSIYYLFRQSFKNLCSFLLWLPVYQEQFLNLKKSSCLKKYTSANQKRCLKFTAKITMPNYTLFECTVLMYIMQ